LRLDGAGSTVEVGSVKFSEEVAAVLTSLFDVSSSFPNASPMAGAFVFATSSPPLFWLAAKVKLEFSVAMVMVRSFHR